MLRSSLLLCLLLALTSFVCVESRAMFHDASSQGAVVAGGVTTSIVTLKSQLDSYIDARCAGHVHAVSGVAKLKKAMPKIDAVGAFEDPKGHPANVRIPISRR
ncbi:unnamed protein product [Aphanomyces euteiches]